MASLCGQAMPATPGVLTVGGPGVEKKIKLRPGNWVARELRHFNDESVGHVVPASSCSKRSYKKYSTLYDVDFSEITNNTMRKFLMEKIADSVEREKMERARETVADVFGGRKTYNTSEMFARWKIPNRLLDDENNPPDAQGLTRLLTASSVKKGPNKSCSQSVDAYSPATPFRSKTTFPDIGGDSENRKETASRHSIMSQSRDRTRLTETRSMSASRPRTMESRRQNVTPGSISPERLKRSHTIIGTQTERKSEVPPGTSGSKPKIDHAVQPGMCDKVEDWIEKAPHVDRAIIQKLLLTAGKKTDLDHAMKRTLLPDARGEVDKWLESATENERQVALQFFTSIAGTGLMTHTGNERRLRLQGVIKALQSGKSMEETEITRNASSRDKKTLKKPTLRFLRLLSPESRDTRWMKTTWHHLPEYKDDNPVNNWRAMYTRPQAPQPTQYVIHPEWG